MVAITAFEAKTRFGELLERVAAGESVVITRHGQPVARIIPISTTDRSDRAAALERLRNFGRHRTLGGMSLRSLIDEGRR